METPKEKNEVFQLPTNMSGTAMPNFVFGQGISALEVGSEGLVLRAAAGKRDWSYAFSPGWRGVILLDRMPFTVTEGCTIWKAGDLAVLAKLQAFMDDHHGLEEKTTRDPGIVSIHAEGVSVLEDRCSTERWFLDLLFNVTPAAALISGLLRRMECYLLVRFLLSHSNDGESLGVLAKRYGVSYSHFRRLCHRALGGPVKAELKSWRMARSLLDITNGGGSVTEVALKHGYASASHFSSDVRGRVGVSPRGLSDITNLVMKRI